jgi:hypothetical protein
MSTGVDSITSRGSLLCGMLFVGPLFLATAVALMWVEAYTYADDHESWRVLLFVFNYLLSMFAWRLIRRCHARHQQLRAAADPQDVGSVPER